MAQRPKSRAVGKVKRTLKKSLPAPSPGDKVRAPKAAKPATKENPPSKAQPSVVMARANGKSVRPSKAVRTAKSPASKKAKPPQTKKPSSKVKTVTASPSAAKTPKTQKAIDLKSADAAKTKRLNKEAAPSRAKAATRPGKAKTPLAESPPKTAKGTKNRPGATKAVSTTRGSARVPKKVPPMPPYLAAELGQPIDHEGEPIGAGSSKVRSDTELQEYALQLWRQMQSGGVVNRYMRAIERAGLTTDEVWTAGMSEARTTSSTPDEMRRYRQKLVFRANLLEAILSETVADLSRMSGIEPASPTTERKTS